MSAALEPLRQQLQQLEAGAVEGDWEGAKEATAHAADAMRAVWLLRADSVGSGWTLPQARVQRVLELLGAALQRYCQVRKE